LLCVSVTNGNSQPRALALGVSSEGAVVERNRTYFLVEGGVWQVGDKIRLTLSQGEATLIAAIAFVPRELMFQFSPGAMMVGAVRELDLITDEPVISTVDKTLYITVLGQQGTSVFNLELIGEREAVIIPGVGVGGSIGILVVIGLLVLGVVLGFLVWYCTVGREKIEIWKAVRIAKKQESQIPDYVPSSGPSDMLAMMPADNGSNVMSTAAARQQLIAQQQQSMHGMFDTAGTGYGDATFGSPRDAASFMSRSPSMYDGGGGRAGTIGGGGDINPVW
jgi:hypothetical protein